MARSRRMGSSKATNLSITSGSKNLLSKIMCNTINLSRNMKHLRMQGSSLLEKNGQILPNVRRNRGVRGVSQSSILGKRKTISQKNWMNNIKQRGYISSRRKSNGFSL